MIYCMLMYCAYINVLLFAVTWLSFQWKSKMEYKWRRIHNQKSKNLENKGDLRINEIRYCWLNELFICQYSFINLNISYISELFRYVNPCIFIWFHGTLVRNWCGVWEVDIWKRVHHDRLVGPYPTE